MTLEDYWVRLYGISRETIRLLSVADTAAGFGLGPDALSAFLEYEWSKVIPTVDDSMETGIQMFPGGNSGLNRMIVKTLIPEAIEGPRGMETTWKNRIDFSALDRPGQQIRIRLQSTAVRVEHPGDPSKSEFVWVTYTQNGKTYRLKARSVVMAGGGWMTKHVVRDLDADRQAAYATFCTRLTWSPTSQCATGVSYPSSTSPAATGLTALGASRKFAKWPGLGQTLPKWGLICQPCLLFLSIFRSPVYQQLSKDI